MSKVFSKILNIYKKCFIIPSFCEDTVASKDLKSVLAITPIVFVYGIIMMCFSFIVQRNHDNYASLAAYYILLIVISIVMAFLSYFLLKHDDIAFKIRQIPCYVVLICVFFFSYWVLFEDRALDEYLVYLSLLTAFNIFLFNVEPFFYSVILSVNFLFSYKILCSFLEPIGVSNIALILFVNILICFWNRYISIKNLIQSYELKKRNIDLKMEEEKSEALLLNILPEKVMNELKEKGTSAPEQFNNVSILFTDIVNFTEASKNLEPEVLINELNDIFTTFDEIIDKNDCYRIKTIGDAYLAVCGLPVPDADHANKLLRCAKEFIEYLNNRNKTSAIKWQMRVGIHSGNVIAGIVGIKKYIYDVFGDAVNTASRMENISESMKINISEETYRLVKDNFNCVKRSPIDVKGNGLMTTYFVE